MTILDPTARPRSGSAGKAAAKTVFACGECGAQHPKWAGQCLTCGAWNSLAEETTVAPGAAAVAREQRALGPLSRLDDVDPGEAERRPTGIGELDRVLGGGFVPGSVTVLGGEPGIGKSTLAMQLVAGWSGPALYVSGEESPQQVKQRADRLAGELPQVWIAAETSLRGLLGAIDTVQPSLVVIDSVQTIADERISSSPGSTTQVRECAQQLVVEAKRRGVAMVLIGHVTKEGALAGPRLLEHVVDTVLSFEGERHHALRLLRAVKHRFGATSELGLFEMTGAGLSGVPDPSHLFLNDRRRGVPGSVIAPVMEGHRPLLVEIQALTVKVPPGAPPRRTTQGVDSSRLAMLLAVIHRRADIPTADQDVYASTVGGVKLVEPGADLAVALAVVSSIVDVPIAPHVVAIGEVGLGGEVRQVPQTARRLAEAYRLGYRTAIVPADAPDVDGIHSVEVDTLAEALARTVGARR